MQRFEPLYSYKEHPHSELDQGEHQQDLVLLGKYLCDINVKYFLPENSHPWLCHQSFGVKSLIQAASCAGFVGYQAVPGRFVGETPVTAAMLPVNLGAGPMPTPDAP